MKKELIKKILTKKNKDKILGVKQIIGKGDVNEIYVVNLGHKKLLLRINEKSEGLTEFKKEKWCIEEAKKKGVLGPTILDIGIKQGYSYMIYEFIEGRSGKDIKNKKEAWTTLGKYAKKINSINVK